MIKIVNGEAVPMTAEEIAAAQPTFAQRQSNMRAALTTKRDAVQYGGMTFAGAPIATDTISQGKIVGAALSATRNPAYTVNWKAGGTFLALDATAILALADAVREFVQACYDREAALLAQINAATSPEELFAIDIHTGWPE